MKTIKYSPTRNTIRDYVDEVSPYTLSVSLIDLLTWVKEQIATHGAEAYLDYDPHHYYKYDTNPSPMFYLKKDRLETDEELQQRLVAEASQALADSVREREQYEALKKKFEGNK